MNCAQIGEPGTGKTESLLTLLPYTLAAKKSFAIIDVDGKLSDHPVFKEPIAKGYFEIFDPGNRLTEGNFAQKLERAAKLQHPTLSPKGWVEVGRIMDELETNSSRFCGAAIDTITTTEDHIKRYISFTNKRGKFEFADWDSLLQSWKELFSFFFNIEMPLKIMNMHINWEKEELTGQVKILPLITGSFRNQAGKDLSEFYMNFCRPTGPDKPPKYLWRVAPDNKFTGRSVVFKGKVEVEQDWGPVWKTLV